MQVQGPTCEQHTMSETVLPKTQTTSPMTPHYRRFLPRWSALWALDRPEPRPRSNQTGGIAPLEVRHAGDTPKQGS